MKKLAVLLVLASFAFAAKAVNDQGYAIVNGKAYFSDHAKVVLNRIHLKTDDGIDLVVPLNKVEAYSVDGRVYQRLPLVCKKGDVKCTALLELVAQRNGLRLYRCYRRDEDIGCSFSDNTGRTCMYFVYKSNNDYHMSVDERNVWTVLPFFGIKTIS